MVVMALPKEKVTVDANIVSQQELYDQVFQLVVKAPEVAALAEAGQFVQLRILNSNCLLRRPVGIAAADKEKGTVAFIYRVVGKGTKAISELKAGDTINVLGPLGHGFDTTAKKPLIVGGGMGLSPSAGECAAFDG